MSLPSFSLQPSFALSDPHWGVQILFHSCVFKVDLFVSWLGRLGEDPGYGVWDRKLVMQSSKGVRREKW